VLLISNLDKEEGLLGVTDCLAVGLLEVLSHRDGLIVVQEGLLHRVSLKVDVCHKIGPRVAPVRNDALGTELKFGNLLILVVAASSLANLLQTLQARGGRHKLEDVVNGKRAAESALEGGRFESLPDFETLLVQHHRVVGVEETGRLADLFQVSPAEGLLDDDVDQLLLDIIVFVVECVVEHEGRLRGLVDRDDVLLTSEHGLEREVLFDLVDRVNALTGADVVAESSLESHSLGPHNAMHLVSIPNGHWLDVQGVLVDLERGPELEEVLI